MRHLTLAKTLLHLMLTIVLLRLGFTTTTAQSDAPYLYYYHPDLNAWVIERADGTDSRLLAQGVSEGTNTAEGEWSSSGEWFAWVGSYFNGPSGLSQDLYAIQTDGTRTSTIARQFKWISSMQWAANAEHLFVTKSFDGALYYLIDVAHDKILWSAEEMNDKQPIDGTLVGDYFVYWNDRETEVESIRDSITLLSLSTGETLKLPQDDTAKETYKTWVNPALLSKPYAAVLFSDTGSLYILDVVNGDLVEIDAHDLKFYSYRSFYRNLQWSSDGQYALITMSIVCENIWRECADIWLLTPEKRSFQHIADNFIYSRPFWLPDKPTAIFTTDEGIVSILNAPSGSVKPVIGTNSNTLFRWAAAGDNLLYADEQDLQTFGVVNISEAKLLTQLHLPIKDYRIHEFSPNDLYASPNGQYAGLGNAQATYDFDSESLFVIPPHSGLTYSHRSYTYYKWDPSTEWLITGQVPSADGGLLRNMVMRVDGSDRRELNMGDEPRWLPEEVITHLPTAQEKNVLPQPHLTLEFEELATAAAWNTSGTRLAVAAGEQLYIWLFEQGEPQIERVIPLEGSCAGYTIANCRINWSLDEHFIALDGFYKSDYRSTYNKLVDLESGKIIGRSDDPFVWDANGFNVSDPNLHPTSTPDASMTAKLSELDTIKTRYDNYAISPLGSWAVTESIYEPSKVYAFGLNTLPRSLNWYAKTVSFTPDDCWLTAVNSWLVTIWKLSDIIPNDVITNDTCMPLAAGIYKANSS